MDLSDRFTVALSASNPATGALQLIEHKKQPYFSSQIVDLLWLHHVLLESTSQKDACMNLAREIIKQDATALDMAMMKERLELEFLDAIGVLGTTSVDLFRRSQIRINTALIYKQQKFNLLREESEGYSKLVVEIVRSIPALPEVFWSAGTDPAPTRTRKIEQSVATLLQNLKSLIGHFELEPNRVLDIIFDVFITNVVDHWDFFVALLLASPWSPRVSRTDTATGKAVRVPRRVCGNILGFKFSYYNLEEVGSGTPSQMYWTAAILIKHGIVGLEDVYAHLGPPDEDIEGALFEEYKVKLRGDGISAGKYSSAGLMGALTSDAPMTIDNTAQKDESKKPPASKRKTNQKAQLCSCLAAIGALNKCRLILIRLPMLYQIQPEIAENVCRLLNVIIEPVYSPLRPSGSFKKGKDIPSRLDFAPSQANLSTKVIAFEDKVLLGRRSPHVQKYRFFYEEWSEGLPTTTDFSQAFTIIRMLLANIGFYLSRDVTLVWKIIRIAKAHVLQTVDDVGVRNGWIQIIANYIFPAFTGIRESLGLGQELFSLLRLFPYETRFALYGEWQYKTYNNVLEMGVERSRCNLDVRYIMKRIAKETIKESSRQIAKAVHSNPLIAFPYIIDQIQSYDNQIQFVVDAFRYMSELDYDIVSFVILDALLQKNDRVQADGTTFSKWLQSLATLCGNLWRKHPLDHQGLLKYLMCQLANNNVHDLVILQELLSQMTGNRTIGESTDAQREALGGGPVLRRELSMTDTIKSKKSCTRFISALISGKLARPLAILIAQQRKQVVYMGDIGELKVLAWMFDHVHSNMLQFIDFVSGNCEARDYAAIFGDIDELCGVYRVEPEVAFYYLRPKLAWLLSKQEVLKATDTTGVGGGDEVMSEEASEAVGTVLPIQSVEGKCSSDVWQKALWPVISAVVSIHGENVWNKISPHFYVTFWQLSLYDIHLPKARYMTEILKQRAIVDAVDGSSTHHGGESNGSKRRKEKMAAGILAKQLENEMKTQELHVERVIQRLVVEKDLWFTNSVDCHPAMIQYCFFPRCVFSPVDAVFCARFTLLMHSLGTHNFHTVYFFDKIFNMETLHATLFGCTEFEAKNYGQFLAELLGTVSAWEKNQELYIKECKRAPGFHKKFKSNQQPYPAECLEKETFEFEDFKRLFRKWHGILKNAFQSCFESEEYMQIRNSILVLDRIREFFPRYDLHGEQIEKNVKVLKKKEERADVKQLALGYHAKLLLFKPKWIKGRGAARNMSGMSEGPLAPPPQKSTSRDDEDSIKPEAHGKNTQLLPEPSTVSKSGVLPAKIQESGSRNKDKGDLMDRSSKEEKSDGRSSSSKHREEPGSKLDRDESNQLSKSREESNFTSKNRDDHISSKNRDDHISPKNRDDHVSSKNRDDHISSKNRDDHISSKNRDDHIISKNRDEPSNTKYRDDKSINREEFTSRDDSNGNKKTSKNSPAKSPRKYESDSGRKNDDSESRPKDEVKSSRKSESKSTPLKHGSKSPGRGDSERRGEERFSTRDRSPRDRDRDSTKDRSPRDRDSTRDRDRRYNPTTLSNLSSSSSRHPSRAEDLARGSGLLRAQDVAAIAAKKKDSDVPIGKSTDEKLEPGELDAPVVEEHRISGKRSGKKKRSRSRSRDRGRKDRDRDSLSSKDDRKRESKDRKRRDNDSAQANEDSRGKKHKRGEGYSRDDSTREVKRKKVEEGEGRIIQRISDHNMEDRKRKLYK